MQGVLSPLEYQHLVEEAPIMIWRSGTNAECDYFNRRWLAFRGRTLEQESGNGWTEGVHPDDLESCLRTYREAFEKQEVFEMEYRLRRYDGVYRWIFDRGAPYADANGDFAGYLGSCTDVSENRLRGLLPICSCCKKIRDEEGDWKSVEGYIQRYSDAQFTHGICPSCLKFIYPDPKKV